MLLFSEGFSHGLYLCGELLCRILYTKPTKTLFENNTPAIKSSSNPGLINNPQKNKPKSKPKMRKSPNSGCFLEAFRYLKPTQKNDKSRPKNKPKHPTTHLSSKWLLDAPLPSASLPLGDQRPFVGTEFPGCGGGALALGC